MSPAEAPPLPQLPTAPPNPPMFGQAPTGQKPKRKPMSPTFLGTEDTPTQGQLGSKTLLGQ